MFSAYVPLATVKIMVSSDVKMEGNYIFILIILRFSEHAAWKVFVAILAFELDEIFNCFKQTLSKEINILIK